MEMKSALLFLTVTILGVIQGGYCQKQSQETCDALNDLTSGRSVEKAGETCEINDDCTQFTCMGVVDPNNNPPVVAESVYTFDPCDDPISFSAVGTVNTLPDPVLDVVVNESSSINFNPDFLGTIHIFLEPTMGGVMLEILLDEPGLPSGHVLFPETEIPLQCEPASAIALHQGKILLMFMLTVFLLVH